MGDYHCKTQSAVVGASTQVDTKVRSRQARVCVGGGAKGP